MPISVFDDAKRPHQVRWKLFRGFLLTGLLPTGSLFLIVLWNSGGSISVAVWWALLSIVAVTAVLAWSLGRHIGEPLDNLHREMRSLLINVTKLVQSTTNASQSLRQQLAEAAVRRERAKSMTTSHWN